MPNASITIRVAVDRVEGIFEMVKTGPLGGPCVISKGTLAFLKSCCFHLLYHNSSGASAKRSLVRKFHKIRSVQTSGSAEWSVDSSLLNEDSGAEVRPKALSLLDRGRAAVSAAG